VNLRTAGSKDFTVTILKRHGQTFMAVGIESKMLAERRIRV